MQLETRRQRQESICWVQPRRGDVQKTGKQNKKTKRQSKELATQRRRGCWVEEKDDVFVVLYLGGRHLKQRNSGSGADINIARAIKGGVWVGCCLVLTARGEAKVRLKMVGNGKERRMRRGDAADDMERVRLHDWQKGKGRPKEKEEKKRRETERGRSFLPLLQVYVHQPKKVFYFGFIRK